MNWPKKMLMVSPEFFDVEYSINPHMLDDDGNLNVIDKSNAKIQWQNLHSVFAQTGIDIEVIDGVAGLPDMVFCANQTFPFLRNGELNMVMSQMASEKRQPEVDAFRAWAKNSNVNIHELRSPLFEGMGDALWDYDSGNIFAGYGFRTRPETYAELEKIVGRKITTFELKDARFYHLDTCLALLGNGTGAYVEEAFTKEGLETLKNSLPTLLRVPLSEATEQLACNMCTPNGKDVVLQQGAVSTVAELKKLGYRIHEVDTSEYIKSGGSVFCMKQLLF